MHPVLTTHHWPTYIDKNYARPTQGHSGKKKIIQHEYMKVKKTQDTMHIHNKSSSNIQMRPAMYVL